MTIIGVVSDKVVIANAHSLCRLRDQLDRRATAPFSIATPYQIAMILLLTTSAHDMGNMH